MATQLDFATRQLANPSAGVQNSLHDLGAMFGQFQQNKLDADKVATEQARYDTEQARLKVQDDRATMLFQRQEEGRKAQLAGEQIATPNIMGSRAVGYDANGKEGEYTKAYKAADIQRAAAENKLMEAQIAKDPSLQAKYTQTLGNEDFMQMNAQGQMVPMSAADRATTERLTREQVLGKYKPQTWVEALTLALQGNRPAEAAQQEQVVPVQTQLGMSYKKVPVGQQVVREATQGTAGVKGKTPDEFAIEKGLVGNLFGTPAAPKTFTEQNIDKIHKRGEIENRYAKLLAPLQEQMRQSSVMATGITGTSNSTFNQAAVKAEKLIAAKNAEIQASQRDKSQPKGTEGIVSRDVWRKANTDERVGIINGAIGNIQDPTKRTALQQEFAKAIKGVAPKPGNKELTKTIYNTVPVLAPGEKVSSKNTYNGKVVTSYSGAPVDMSGVPTNARGPIVDAHKGFANKVKDMFSVQDALAITSKRVLGELATKHGVTRKEMDVDGILKSSGMDGTMTPQQERQVKMWEGELSSITEQYKQNQTQANADRAYKLQVQQLQNQMSQFSMSHSLAKSKLELDKNTAKVQQSEFAKMSERESAKYMTKELYLSPAERSERDSKAIESIKTRKNSDVWFPNVTPWATSTKDATKEYADALVARARKEQKGILSAEDEAAIRAGL